MPQGDIQRTEDLPAVIPVFPLDGALLLPRAFLPLQIFEPRYLNMIDDALAGPHIIGMIQTIPGGEPARPHLAGVGCAGRVTGYSETSDGRYLITLTGVCRFHVVQELSATTPYRQVRPNFQAFARDMETGTDELEFDRTSLLVTLRNYLDVHQLGVDWEAVNAAPGFSLVDSLCMALPFSREEKQALIEAKTFEDRRLALAALLQIGAAWSKWADDDPSVSIQ